MEKDGFIPLDVVEYVYENAALCDGAHNPHFSTETTDVTAVLNSEKSLVAYVTRDSNFNFFGTKFGMTAHLVDIATGFKYSLAYRLFDGTTVTIQMYFGKDDKYLHLIWGDEFVQFELTDRTTDITYPLVYDTPWKRLPPLFFCYNLLSYVIPMLEVYEIVELDE